MRALGAQCRGWAGTAASGPHPLRRPERSNGADGAKKPKTEAQAARQSFLAVWEGLRTEILADPMLAQRDAAAWMAHMLDHNVPGGKLNRGMAVKDVLLAYKPDASVEDQLRADQLGWCTEFLQVRAVPPPRAVSSAHPDAPTRRRSSWWRTTSWTTPSRVAGSRAGTA